jgi:hypothetical protein
MDNSNNNNTRTFSLSKAQKYLDKLRSIATSEWTQNRGKRRQQYSSSNSFKCYLTVSELNNFSKTDEEFRANFEKMAQDNQKMVTSKLNLIRDYKNFKNMVYNQNANCGLSNVLTQIDLLEEERQIYESIKSNLDSYHPLGSDKLSDVYSKLGSYISTEMKEIKFAVFNPTDVSERMKQINRELEALENKRDKLNANTSITFTFSQDTIDLIGL